MEKKMKQESRLGTAPIKKLDACGRSWSVKRWRLSARCWCIFALPKRSLSIWSDGSKNPRSRLYPSRFGGFLCLIPHPSEPRPEARWRGYRTRRPDCCKRWSHCWAVLPWRLQSIRSSPSDIRRSRPALPLPSP